MTNITELTAEKLEEIRQRYRPTLAPKCHICGVEMTIQRMSASRITYGCAGAIYDETGCHYAEGRSLADDHYAESRITVVDVSDPDVLAMVEALEKAQGMEAYWKTQCRGITDHCEELQARIAELESRTVTAAAADVLAERQRQVTAEGWTAERDDGYQNSELADAAACYAIHAHNQGFSTPAYWPWSQDWWKQTSPRRDLVKAGALILAEIERLDRAAGIKVEADSLDADGSNRNQPGMVVAVHIDVGDFVKFRGQVYEVKETDFDDHDVTLWFVCGEVLKCAAGCQIEVVSAPVEDE
ncbi:TPA: ead/Ea22-like family protein [Klebsiella variicola subsp. variicola]|nr:ead/Ea22-like family protein [Klebsiella variicola subsp. variicola]